MLGLAVLFQAKSIGIDLNRVKVEYHNRSTTFLLSIWAARSTLDIACEALKLRRSRNGNAIRDGGN